VQNASGTSSVNVPVAINPPPAVQNPVAKAVAAPNPAFSGASVSLDASSSTDPNTPPQALSFSWSQTGGPAVTLTNSNAAVAGFSAPNVPNGQPSTSVSFQVTVTNAGGLSSTASVTVTVNPVLANPVANATASPNPTPSAGTVTLNGTASTDPNGLVLSYSWQQTGGSAVTLKNANAAVASFVAPIVPAGLPPATLNFLLTVRDTAGMSASAPVAVVVAPQPDTIAITSAQYRTGKARMTVNATDSVVSQSLVLTCILDIINPATGQPYAAVMSNTGNGTYTVIFVGTGIPTRVTVTSSGGGTATTTNISVRN
jgi:large repetitive protein